MKLINAISLCLVIAMTTSCHKSDPTPLEELPYGQYLKEFNDYAAQYGLDYEKELRKLKFERIDGFAEGISCDNGVILVPDFYEAVYGEDFTGQLIYHQIGHCLLERKHRDDKFENGEWKSLMRSGPYLSGIGQAIDFEGNKKEYYLTELFDQAADPADFSFETAPIPFDENLARVLVQELECGVIYNELMADGDHFDIEVLYDFYAPPTDIFFSMFDKEGHYMRIFQQKSSYSLLTDDPGFGPRFSYNIIDYPGYEDGFTLTIRALGDKCIAYINHDYLFAYTVPPAGLREIIAAADTQIGSCGPTINLYKLE